MNFDKVKEALEEIINQDTGTWDKPVPFSILHTRALDIARAALAELEKPAEDDAFDLALRVLAFNPSTENATGRLADMIQQYAESYHAKKCAHCQKIVYCELCGDPITVGVCENCVPDMLSNEGHFHSTDIGNFRKKLNSDIDEIIKKEPEPPHA